MLKTRFWSRGVYTVLAILLMASVQFAWGFEDRGREHRERPQDARREQLRQEAQASASEVSQLLTEILQQVNQNKKPEAELITNAATMLEENKRSLMAYDDEQKSQYMLLQAWTYFYQNQSEAAMNWALRSCKMDEASQDTWNSQAVFCLLNGKRPLEPRIKKSDSRRDQEEELQRQQRRAMAGRMNAENKGPEVEPYSRAGTLVFELTALRKDMLKERFSRFQYKAFDGSGIEYVPGEDTLCVLFWQVESVVDPNESFVEGPAEGVKPIPRPDDIEFSHKISLAEQGGYFHNIYETVHQQPKITCFALNTNGVQNAEKVATGMDDDFAREMMSTPMVFASGADSGAANYVGVNAQVPFLLIADTEGIVRYAGPAADFMPAFILTQLTGVEIPLGEVAQVKIPDTINGVHRTYMEEFMAPGRPMRETIPERPVREPDQPVSDPNRPAADPNLVPSAVQPRDRKSVEPVEMSLEDQDKANRLLSLAQLEIEACRTIRGKSPAKGVDACKEILEKYPGTSYAEKAREQLRRVPDRYWEKYGIADLLGY